MGAIPPLRTLMSVQGTLASNEILLPLPTDLRSASQHWTSSTFGFVLTVIGGKVRGSMGSTRCHEC